MDDSGIVRTSAIEALGNFREDRVKNVLLKLLSDKDAEIRSTAIESLSFFKGVAGNIIPVLKDHNWAVRKKGVEVLGRAFIKESYSYLKDIADLDKDIEVRKAALRCLSV
jgi:HEAT repeat protein